MNTELLQLLAGNAGAIVLLGAVLLFYLPQRDKAQERVIKNIVSANERALKDLSLAIMNNTKTLGSHSRACLVRTLTASGLPAGEAMQSARDQIPE